MAEREILSGNVRLEPFGEKTVSPNPIAWLAARARAGMTLLAHMDDGIIWGLGEDKRLRLAPIELKMRPEWRAETLQMARLFDDYTELFLWRTGEQAWRARRLTDGEGHDCQTFDESQILWGTRVEAAQDGFALVAEGEQGLRHTPALALAPEDWRENHLLRLDVRHYLSTDEEGWLRVTMSRLKGLRKESMR